MIDATFWVAISFLLFVVLLFYFKVPQKIDQSLNESIKGIKNEIEHAEKLKDEAKNILSDYDSKVSKSKAEIKKMLENAEKQSEQNIIKTNEDFHFVIENRKKTAEDKIKRLQSLIEKDKVIIAKEILEKAEKENCKLI